ncbi:hypothetical protein H9L05_20865 [Hymenobacter qilianensis]|uniref:Uncharacterized protein n=1 Tax=Hymenobacter qilianensis TaxID=1385715 RepID=A0A7H0GVD9_9BACT|nr:hypothetical protein [Hymenobacter qilianensis]QNP52255.1 hypothetical protein H9L05_20865 [Hymenobacter qilianensis]
MKKSKKENAKKDKKAAKQKNSSSLFGGSKKSGKKGRGQNGIGALTNGQKVAGGAALLAAAGLGYWAQSRRANAKTTAASKATAAEKQTASQGRPLSNYHLTAAPS